MLRKNNKRQAAAALLCFGSQHAHNTRRECREAIFTGIKGAMLPPLAPSLEEGSGRGRASRVQMP